MKDLSPEAFASLLRKTNELREASWKELEMNLRDWYELDWNKAAELACRELGIDPRWARIASITCFPGYCDVWDWCDEVAPRVSQG